MLGLLIFVFCGLSFLEMVIGEVSNGDDLFVGTGFFGSEDFGEASCELLEMEGKQPSAPSPGPTRNLRIANLIIGYLIPPKDG